VDVSLVDGRLFSLAFSTPPQQLSRDAEPGQVRLWLDPMVPGAAADPAALGVRLPEGARALRSDYRAALASLG